jgi:hypothetical protein
MKLRMRVSPSIVPRSDDTDTYLVFDNFGRLGRAWPETDEEDADRETLLRHLMERPIQRSGPHRQFHHRRGMVAGCVALGSA